MVRAWFASESNVVIDFAYDLFWIVNCLKCGSANIVRFRRIRTRKLSVRNRDKIAVRISPVECQLTTQFTTSDSNHSEIKADRRQAPHVRTFITVKPFLETCHFAVESLVMPQALARRVSKLTRSSAAFIFRSASWRSAPISSNSSR